jgi:acetyl-CoA carboxylase biotin carboxylase subunit
VREDSGAYEGYTVPRFYDTLLAKLIVWDTDRRAAIARGARALGELVVEGVPTTRGLALEILESSAFRSGEYSTSFLAQRVESAVEVV